MNKKFSFLAIGDIHWGAINYKTLYNELNEYFISYLENNDIDAIFILGDYFNHKLSLNEKSSIYAIKFLEKIISISYKKNKNFILRIIKGTNSHDLDQLEIFSKMKWPYKIDTKFIFNVSDEILSNGLRILYLPEEYVKSKKDYYKNHLYNEDNEYDFCFGHGNLKNIMKSIKLEKNILSAKEFTLEDFSCINQIVLFGHYHINSIYKNKLYYTGSFTRWKYGEENPKGFYHCIYDFNKNTTKMKFIENKSAKIYKTININSLINNDLLKIEDKIKEIENYKNEYDNIRFIISNNNIDKNDVISLITNYFSNNKNVKFKIDKSIDSIIEVDDKYKFLFDKSKDIYDKIYEYIKLNNENKIEINKEDIKLYIERS